MFLINLWICGSYSDTINVCATGTRFVYDKEITE